MGIIGLAFGICLESNLTHGESFKEKANAVLNSAYWPLFGEIEDVLDKLDEKCTSTEENKCLSSFTYVTSYVLLMIYMVIGSILLINLLIAIFRFDKTHIFD